MSYNHERENLLNLYLSEYTPENRIEFAKLVLSKYRFEKYVLNDYNIDFSDMIVQDETTRNMAESIINKNECTEDDFIELFNMLDLQQIDYIGF